VKPYHVYEKVLLKFYRFGYMSFVQWRELIIKTT